MSTLPAGYEWIPGGHHGGGRKALPGGGWTYWYATEKLARAAYRSHRKQASHLRNLGQRTGDLRFEAAADEHDAHARDTRHATFGSGGLDALRHIDRTWTNNRHGAADAVRSLQDAHDVHTAEIAAARDAYLAAVEAAHAKLSVTRGAINALHESFGDLAEAGDDAATTVWDGLDDDDDAALDEWVQALDERRADPGLETDVATYPTAEEVLTDPKGYPDRRSDTNWFDDDEIGPESIATEAALVAPLELGPMRPRKALSRERSRLFALLGAP